MAQGKVLVVPPVVHNNLERQRIEEVNENPHAQNGGEVQAGAGYVVAKHVVVGVEGVEHDADGHDPEEEKQIAVKRSHKFGL